MNEHEQAKQDIREVLCEANRHIAEALCSPTVSERDLREAKKYITVAENMLAARFKLDFEELAA